jgi:hypothetical protein
MNKKHTEYWRKAAERLQELETPRVVKVRQIMELYGYATTSAALYALMQFETLGLVEHIGREWRLK